MPLDVSRLAAGDRRSFERQAGQAARLLRSLANDRRLLILCKLVDGERSVGELAELVGLGQSALSQHLAKLRAEGIVATRRDAQTIYYALASPEAVAVLETLARLFCPPTRPRRTS